MRHAGLWLFGLLSGLFIALGAPVTARAQAPFPNHVVKIVLPVLPGSTTDILARLIANQLSE